MYCSELGGLADSKEQKIYLTPTNLKSYSPILWTFIVLFYYNLFKIAGKCDTEKDMKAASKDISSLTKTNQVKIFHFVGEGRGGDKTQDNIHCFAFRPFS